MFKTSTASAGFVFFILAFNGWLRGIFSVKSIESEFK